MEPQGDYRVLPPYRNSDETPILDRDIKTLKLSVRARKGIQQAVAARLGLLNWRIIEVKVGELVQLYEDEVLDIKGIGIPTITEIKAALKAHGLALKTSHWRIDATDSR